MSEPSPSGATASRSATRAPANGSAAGRFGCLPLVSLADGDRARPVVLALVVGLRGEKLENVLDLLGRQRSNGGPMPVVLTDSDDFLPLRDRRLPFEYLPPKERRRRYAPDLNWDLYVLRRLAILRRKWQPVRIVAFGLQARMLLDAWRASPFEAAEPGPDLGNV